MEITKVQKNHIILSVEKELQLLKVNLKEANDKLSKLCSILAEHLEEDE